MKVATDYNTFSIEPYSISNPPKPFNREKLQKIHQWVREEEDDLIPRGGFLSDFDLKFRGMESPTLFVIWSAIFAVSCGLKRDAWVSWNEDKLVANLFLIFVGGPGVSKKSTSVGLAADLLRNLPEIISNEKIGNDPVFAEKKRLVLIEGLTTDEKLFQDLNLKEKTVKDPKTGRMERVNPGASGVFVLSELTAAISRGKGYMEGFMNRLLDLYDCRANGTEMRTKKSGTLSLKRVFFNMLAATTKGLIATQLPEEALTGGFLSRTIFIHKDKSKRIWMIPVHLSGCPNKGELGRRLLYVLRKAQGEFTFEPNAYEWMMVWYAKFRTRLDYADELYSNVHSRAPIHLIKVSMILRAQDYAPGNNIRLQDIKLAGALLDSTYETSMDMVQTLGSNPIWEIQEALEYRLRESKGHTMTRRESVDFLGRKATLDEINTALSALIQRGLVTVSDLEGNPQKFISRNPAENYTLIEDPDGIFKDVRHYKAIGDTELMPESLNLLSDQAEALIHANFDETAYPDDLDDYTENTTEDTLSHYPDEP